MKAPERTRRRVLPQVLILAACLVCLTAGFYTGKLYAKNENPAPQIVDVDDDIDPALVTIGERPKTSSGRGVEVKIVKSSQYVGEAGKGKQKPICLNTCKMARDGKCDDGRIKPSDDPNKPHKVFCDLGTDCDDCGPWTPTGPALWGDGKVPGPIARLGKKSIEVRVRRTVTKPGFHFAYTDPGKDFDVSNWIENAGLLEAAMTKVFHAVFKAGCRAASGKRALFVDVGANFGFYSVLAAAMGCRVIAFEPVPHFHAFFEFSVHLNGLAHLVDMRHHVVGHESGQLLEMVVPETGIWGTASVGGQNIDKAVKSQLEYLKIPSRKLDDEIKENVLLLKVDVEGWEWSVMRGARRLMSNYQVTNVIMEYSPGVPERSFRTEELQATVQMLVDLCKGGHRIAHMGEYNKHLALSDWDAPLGAFEEVTLENLKYDLRDVQLFKSNTLGCPVPKPLKPYWAWRLCDGVPEDLNPRSLRACLGHNTNLWASKDRSLQQLEGVVGILPLDAPAGTYFVPNGSEHGMGSRLCAHLEAKVQVRHRCPCTDEAVCGEEARIAARMAAEGQLSSNYVLPPFGST